MLPILSKQQFEVYTCLIDRGLSISETASELRTSESVVENAVTAMRDKGEIIPYRTKPVPYHDGMDKDVREKY
jgi:predicted transcriptional regulator